ERVNGGGAGTEDVEVRVGSDGAGGTFHIEVDGVDKTGPLVVPNTGGWQSWSSVTKTAVTLGSGTEVWRLVLDSNGPTTAVGNFDWIRVSQSAGGAVAAPVLASRAAGTGFSRASDIGASLPGTGRPQLDPSPADA